MCIRDSLSIEMKTKVVQHVKSDWMRDWMSVTVRKSESEIVRESEKAWVFLNIPGSQLLSDIQTFFTYILTQRFWLRIPNEVVLREANPAAKSRLKRLKHTFWVFVKFVPLTRLVGMKFNIVFKKEPIAGTVYHRRWCYHVVVGRGCWQWCMTKRKVVHS